MMHLNTEVSRSAIMLSTDQVVGKLCPSYFFYIYVWHRYLLSFPTRRSSDLAAGFCALAGPSRDTHLDLVRCAQAAVRSEEHTSELQSHVNFVCRLLLEKK